MKLRRYIGKDMQEAMLKVKMELGNEAVVLNTRKIRQKGLFNFFKKPLIEILVALDENQAQKQQNQKQQNQVVQNQQNLAMAQQNTQPQYAASNAVQQQNIINQQHQNIIPNQHYNNTSQNVMASNNAIKAPVQAQAEQSILKQGSQQATLQNNVREKEKEEKINELENKVSKMESLMLKVYDEIKNLPNKTIENISEQGELNKLFYSKLLKSEIEPEVIESLIAKASLKIGKSSNITEIANVMSDTIAEMLGKAETITLKNDGKPTVVIFIGPTGVGKTTTLAKIAANYSLNLKKQVGLITADTYRIAAVDQLKTYADILGIPVSVVYSPSEIKTAIENFNDKDIVLIDTAGRSFREKEQFEELKNLISSSGADEVYLVMSSTTSISNCKEIIESYSFLENYKLIFTKLDETPVVGVVLNARHYTNKCLSYITTGQSVPDDIEVADTERLTKNLLGSIQK